MNAHCPHKWWATYKSVVHHLPIIKSAILLYLNSYGGTVPLGTLLIFEDDSKWRLLSLGCFPACWSLANVTPIPKGHLIIDQFS